MAQVKTLLGNGRPSAVRAATVGAIAARNLGDVERRQLAMADAVPEPEPPPSRTTLGDAARDRLVAYVDTLPAAERIQADDSCVGAGSRPRH